MLEKCVGKYGEERQQWKARGTGMRGHGGGGDKTPERVKRIRNRCREAQDDQRRFREEKEATKRPSKQEGEGRPIDVEDL